MTLFYATQDGQHDIYPIGGDDDDSPGARDADKGALAGRWSCCRCRPTGCGPPQLPSVRELSALPLSVGVGAYTAFTWRAPSTTKPNRNPKWHEADRKRAENTR